MSKILIIGVSGGGILAVENMKKVGIPEANYIGIGMGCQNHAENIPYYDLREMNGNPNLPAHPSPNLCRMLAENVEEQIGKIINKHIKD